MKVCFVTFRSITFAQRGQEVLRRGGITATLTRTPRQMAEQGCGYRLSMGENKLTAATAMLEAADVPYSKIYCPHRAGEEEESP